MRIHPLRTGSVSVKHSFLHARGGLMRQPALFLPSQWSPPLPIHCWAIEHDGRLLLVDTGETADARDIAFARFDVQPQDELPEALAQAGLSLDAVDAVILTHLHGDHMDGAIHVGCEVLVHERELAFARSRLGRVQMRLFRQPLPDAVAFRGVDLPDGPFGAFPESRALSDDGRIVLVPTPGHTAAHCSVVCIDDEGRHVLLAGDATDTLEQLRDRRPDAVGPKPRMHVATLDRVLAHGRRHPTVYLPSHDPESAARLAAGVPL